MLKRYFSKVFDRKLKRIHKQNSSPEAKYLQREVGMRLTDRLLDIKRRFPRILDIGSENEVAVNLDNEITDELCALNEFSVKSLENCPDFKLHRCIGDLEHLPIGERQYDAVTSNLALHWVNELPTVFKNINNILKSDGVFIASLLGGDTLYELRSSLQLAGMERKSGITQYISPMISPADLGSLLTNAQFQMITVDIDDIVVKFPSMFELLDDLKMMGESNSTYNR